MKGTSSSRSDHSLTTSPPAKVGGSLVSANVGRLASRFFRTSSIRPIMASFVATSWDGSPDPSHSLTPNTDGSGDPSYDVQDSCRAALRGEIDDRRDIRGLID